MITTNINGKRDLDMGFTCKDTAVTIHFSDHAIERAEEQSLDFYLLASTIMVVSEDLLELSSGKTAAVYDDVLGIALIVSVEAADGGIFFNVITNNNYIPRYKSGKIKLAADVMLDVNACIGY